MDQYLGSRRARCDAIETFNKACQSKPKVLESKWKLIEKSHKELQRQKDLLSEKNGGSNVSDGDILEINAGGLLVTATRNTFTQHKGTCLEALFSGRWEEDILRDANGRIFLDVNPTCFKTLVDHLNERKIAPLDHPPSRPTVDTENQVYLDSLITWFGLGDALSTKGFLQTKHSTILTDEAHLRALDEFLAEDDIIVGEVTLLYRGTRDGMNASNFHRLCDNQGPTVAVVKSSDGYIFGGFADKPWQSISCGTWMRSPKAFLFALRYSTGGFPVKMKQKQGQEKYALRQYSTYGPTFGGGHDLATLGTRAYASIGHTYALPPGQSNPYFITGASSYSLSEIEVFKIDPSAKRGFSTEASSSPSPPNSSARRPPTSRSDANSRNKKEPWESLTFDEFPSTIKEKLKAEKEALAVAAEELARLQDAFEKEKQIMHVFAGAGNTNEVEDDVVQLNVSGQIMATKRSTLGQIPGSVLCKQFNEPRWKGNVSQKSEPPHEWNPEQVVEWAKSIPNLTEDVSSQLSELTGAELLAFEREDAKDLGVKRGTVALLCKAIQKLRDDEAASSTTFIEHNDYCFGKILDHLRLKAMCKVGSLPKPAPPKIRDADKVRFKTIVEYYFPGDEKAEFLG